MPQHPSSALLTDHYELTMLAAALADGTADRLCSFEVFARGLPSGRRYGVVAGTGRLLERLADFRFGPAELSFLSKRRIVRPEVVEWLEAFEFAGDIWGYPEGEVFFPGSPIVIVEAAFGQAVLLETLVLSIVNHDSAIAAAGSRMRTAAGPNRRLVEMGARRTHEEAAIAAARAAWLVGFDQTSDLAAGMRWDIPTGGTSGHAFVLVHDSERDAFRTQIETLGADTVVLVDTYDIATAVATAVDLAGPALGAVRVDSGDLGPTVQAVREQLDSLGATNTKIVVSGDLDEFSIAQLDSYPIDSYGAGTSLVTGSGAPTAGMVYKLAAVDKGEPGGPLEPVAKRSSGKQTRGGRKDSLRGIDDGIATAEIVRVIDADDVRTPYAEPGSVRKGARGLLAQLVDGGTIVGTEDLVASRERHAAALAELPPAAHEVTPGDAALPTVLED